MLYKQSSTLKDSDKVGILAIVAETNKAEWMKYYHHNAFLDKQNIICKQVANTLL